MPYQNVFMRHETKYLVTNAQQDHIIDALSHYMAPDCFGKSLICNVYYDTPDFRLIRRSIEKPIYKEKLRLRSYGTAHSFGTVFVELKRKFKGVVYKRRLNTTEESATAYLSHRGKPPGHGQIQGEIDYFLDFYKNLAPAAFISYRREAFYAGDTDFRVTFDQELLWRDCELSLCAGIYGQPLLPEGTALMELKTAGAIPLWMTEILSQNVLYKTAFSKYGSAYRAMHLTSLQEEYAHA